ncbi:MAG: VWA domain-containing protein [Woeseiaceae bacterium]|nr:VWA domain-containing protein [Woeseiaceae bacterium]
MNNIAAIGFSAPWMWLLIIAFVPAIIAEFAGQHQRRAMPVSGIDIMRVSPRRAALQKKVYRAATLLITALLMAAVSSAPTLQTAEPVLLSDQLSRQKDLMLAIDVSRSMSGPLELADKDARFAAYGQVSADAAKQRTRYDAARETIYRFVDRFPDARIGLILFSTEPFLARWPTTDTSTRFLEVLDDNLSELSQLRRFSSLTNIDSALFLAGDVFTTLATSQGGAVILISDAEDEFENMGVAIRALRDKDIRLYTIGVGIAESVVQKLSDEFAGDTGFRIFRVDSEQEMQEAYQLVAELEESPRFSSGERIYVTDLRWLLALLLAIFSVFALALTELLAPRISMVHTVARRAQ